MPRVKLKYIVELAEGTIGFYFEKPAVFQFSAGQFGEWTLIDPPETDPEGNFRTFTIASAPAEEDLMVATRMRDTHSILNHRSNKLSRMLGLLKGFHNDEGSHKTRLRLSPCVGEVRTSDCCGS